MSDQVGAAYDSVAEIYVERFLGELAADADAAPWLDAFVEAVDVDVGPVADDGCGPGAAVDVLTRRGLPTFGIDLSDGLLAAARKAFPDLEFRRGDLTRLGVDDGSLAGIFSRYSIIHLHPTGLDAVFAEWARALAPGAPVLLFFFASRAPANHATPFDHKVTTAFELWPPTVATHLEASGFVDVRVGATPPADGGRPLDKGAVLARRRDR